MKEHASKSSPSDSIALITTVDLCDANAKPLGLACGNVVMSRNVGKDLMAGLKTIMGGEINTWTTLMAEARDIARKRMEECALTMGADAVVGVRFASHALEDAAEVLAYGTAVKYVEAPTVHAQQ